MFFFHQRNHKHLQFAVVTFKEKEYGVALMSFVFAIFLTIPLELFNHKHLLLSSFLLFVVVV